MTEPKKASKNLCPYIFDPFTVIKDNKLDFFIWVSFALIAGQLGILANLILRYFTHSIPIRHSIYLDSSAGSFYTFSIAIAASALGPLFSTFIRNKKPEFSSIKIVTIILITFYLIISGYVYSAVQIKSLNSNIDFDLGLDLPQLIVYICAILISSYVYCLMKIGTPEYSHLDDSFNETDDQNVEDVIKNSQNLTQDESGIKL